MIEASVLDAMLVAGCSAEQIVAVVKAAMVADRDAETDRREADRMRKRRQREREANSTIASDLSRGQTVTDMDGVTTPSPPPSPSPDKAIPQTPLENNPTPLPPPQPKTSKRTRLNADWVLPKAMGDWALAQGLPRERILLEAEKMRDWAVNAGSKGLKADWFAAWRNWVKGAIDDLPKARGSPGVRPKSGLAAVMEEFKQELAEDGYGDQGQEGRNSQNDERFPLLAGPRDK